MQPTMLGFEGSHHAIKHFILQLLQSFHQRRLLSNDGNEKNKNCSNCQNYHKHQNFKKVGVINV